MLAGLVIGATVGFAYERVFLPDAKPAHAPPACVSRNVVQRDVVQVATISVTQPGRRARSVLQR